MRVPGGPHRLLRLSGEAALTRSVRHARTDLADKPINKHTLTDMFHALEVVTGVVPVEGRGWYGIRRMAIDLNEDYESDERVLSATGHISTDTRRKKYQQRNRGPIFAKTAVTRRRVRAGASGHSTADEDAPEGAS